MTALSKLERSGSAARDTDRYQVGTTAVPRVRFPRWTRFGFNNHAPDTARHDSVQLGDMT